MVDKYNTVGCCILAKAKDAHYRTEFLPCCLIFNNSTFHNIPSLHAGVLGRTVMCGVKGFVSDWCCLPALAAPISLFRFRGRAQVWAGRRWAVMFGMWALHCYHHYHHQHQRTPWTRGCKAYDNAVY